MTRIRSLWFLLLLVRCGSIASPYAPAADRSTLLVPADSTLHAPVQPVLKWTRVPGALRYLIQVAGDSTFAAPSFGDSSVTDTVLRVPRPLQNDSGYYWRVGSMDSTLEVTFSGLWWFRTGRLPHFPVDSLSFPDTRVGDSSVVFVLLKNPMPVPLLVDSAVSAGGDFLFLDGASFVLPPSDSLVCSVLYRPARFRRSDEDLVLHTEQGILTIRVRGDSPPPVLSVSRQHLDFGTAAVTDTVPRTIVLRNRGSVNRLSFFLGHRRYSPYQILRASRGSLAPGESLRVVIRMNIQSYRVSGYGLHTDTLQVDSDGGRAFIPIVGNSPPPRLRCVPQTLVYPEVGVADTAVRELRVWNSSINVLRVDSIRTGSSRLSCAPGRITVRRGDTTAITVRFFPDRPGTVEDTLLVYNNSWVSPYRVPVAGYVPPPLLVADVESHDFGQVVTGSRAHVHFTLVNRSVSPLRIELPATRTRAFVVSAWKGPVRLRFGDTVGVSVWFSPDSLRLYRDTLVLVNNSLRSPFRIPLGGSGTRDLQQGLRAEPVFELYQNFPNPFSGETTFRYVLPTTCTVELEVFSTLGEHIETVFRGVQGEGFHNLNWAPRLATGVYYYRLRATPEGRPDKAVSATRKMVVTR